ncbi:MAG: enoyl-CoA hydratase-related protein, partial [Actinomycetes bacterium]
MSDEVRVERRGAVQVVTINRPDARNALDASVARGIADAVDELDASAELRAGVLTGAGGSFSAGMDLKAFLRGETPVVGGRGLCGITVTRPREPLVAAVEGWALAGGFELVLACDLVVAGRTAGFGVPEVTRSLVAAGGAALLLPQRVPRAVALEMLLTGRPIDALPSGAATDGLLDGGNGRRGPVVGTDVERFPLRLVVLGDSIAFGTGALRIEDTLGRRLATALIADGFDVDLHVLAVPGSVSRDLAAQVRRAEPLAADVAVIVIGAN